MNRKTKNASKYLVLMELFLLFVVISLGYLLVRQTKRSIVSLMQTRMLDISNTAAAMVDGDVLRDLKPEDEGTEGYENVMRTLGYFRDNIDLKYIYCIRDMGDGTFTFGLDPTLEDPGEFGSPIVYTDALYRASKGTPAADEVYYEDAWGSFYSAYSPVSDSHGNVAGIIAVDFSAEWYNAQLSSLTWTTILVAFLSLLIGGVLVTTIVTRSQRKIETIHGQLNELESTLLQEMGNTAAGEEPQTHAKSDDPDTIDSLGKQIQIMQEELKTQIAHVHGQAYRDGLTGVKSKHAYLDAEQTMDGQLRDGTQPAFAIVVCDVNGLKQINDRLGHKAGDEYIRNSCRMICDIFTHSPVYRVGGDEFVVILTGRDYEQRRALMHELHSLSSAHITTGGAIVSGGMAEYDSEKDHFTHEVFERADTAMYREKAVLRSLGAVSREDEPEQTGHEPGFEDILAMSVRKHILIADDMETNREILGDLLMEDYDILYAADGMETLEVLRKYKDEIALLILDLYMPKLSGKEVLTEMQTDGDLMFIPVIVLTIDQQAELECLKIGAMDFIPKPYPDIDIIKARIAKCIEMAENRDLIRRTQRDKLTGLFNFDYFIRYVNHYDQHYRGAPFDALVCCVSDYHSVTEQYGRQYGELVLRSIGSAMYKLARRTGGIGCRKEGELFLLYCPHQREYDTLLKKYTDDLFLDQEMADKVMVRYGIYENAQEEPDIEERFVRAKLAAEKAEDDPQALYGIYGNHNSTVCMTGPFPDET